MYLKLPIVTTNISENKDVVKNNVDALLVNRKNPVQLAKAINEILENKTLAKELAKNAYNKSKKYDIKRVVKKLECVYE